MEKYKYVIIGNSAAAVGAIEGIRVNDRDGSILSISEEPRWAYSRPLISYYLNDEAVEKRMGFRGEAFYHGKKVDCLLGIKVITADLSARTLKLSNKESVGYEKLLIAVGGKPIVPEIKGSNKAGVMTFTTYADAQKLRKGITSRKNRRVVILGGGLIGLKAAEGLIEAGVKVTIVELAKHCLAPVLDETSARMVEKVFVDKGCNLYLGRTIKEIKGKNKVIGVALDDGTNLSADFVILAIGVRPRLELFEKSKELKTNRGVVVDKHLKTSVENVYAAGDVAEVYDFVIDGYRPVLIWPNAYYGGKVAGINMSGGDKEYTWATGMNAADFFGLATVSAGMIRVPENNPQEYEVITHHVPEKQVYKKFILKNGIVTGMIIINEIEPSGVILGLMRDKMDLSAVKDKLVLSDFGLAYLPEEVRKAKVNKQ
ncbi:MAG: FAD-dependent oxidoreductase [Elusimicrobiota bacterium]